MRVPGLLLALLVPCLPPDSPGDAQLALAREALARGDGDSALAAALLGLEFAPEDAGLLEVASRAAEAGGRTDEALWLGSLARDQISADGDARALAAVEARLAALDPTEEKALQREVAFFGELLETARAAERRRLYLNAADLLARCERGPLAGAARAELDRLYGNKRALDALLSAGVDVPVRTASKRSAAWIARENARRASWENAHQLKGDNYTVVTNMDYETAEAILLAMEQMNRFYRRVFQHRERGGNTARCTIHVYRTRQEFDLHEPTATPAMGGFYVNGENRVATFDPRTGRPPRLLAELWTVLFHEASHQFTAMIAATDVPSWLNEGTASYFEGARLLQNGAVEANLVPEERLASLVHLLDNGGPTLREVIAYAERGSYAPEYYPYGWGLVYFLHNYENEAAERIYLPHYRALLASYGSGKPQDPFERFVELIIVRARVPGVRSFEAFEERWREWIAELWTLQSGGPEKADELIARGRRQALHSRHEAARDSFRWALRKRPGDPAALLGLARAHEAMGEGDAALVGYRRAREAVAPLSPGDPVPGGDGAVSAFLEACAARERKLDRQLAERLEALRTGYTGACVQGARAYAREGLPRSALLVLERAESTLGPDRGWSALRREIEGEHGKGLLGLWRRLTPEAGPGLWQLPEGWRPEGTGIAATAAGPSFALWSGPLPDRLAFQVRMRLRPEGESSSCGVIFATGGGGEGLEMVTLSADGVLEIRRFTSVGSSHRGLLYQVAAGEEVLLEVERAGEEARFRVNGKLVRTRRHPGGRWSGEVGLWAYGGGAMFDLPRVRL